MDTPEKFEDIMRSKFTDRNLPVDESNWENIKRMTDAAREKKKRRRWFVIFFIGLVCGIGITIPFIVQNVNSESIISENQTKTPELKEEKQSESKQILNEKQEQKKNNTVAPENTDEEKTVTTQVQSIEHKEGVIPSVAKMKADHESGNSSVAGNASAVKKEKHPLVVLPSDVKNESANRSKSEGKNANDKSNTNDKETSTQLKSEEKPQIISAASGSNTDKTKPEGETKNEIPGKSSQQNTNENNSVVESVKDTVTKSSNTAKIISPDSSVKKTTVVLAEQKDTTQKQPETPPSNRKNIFSIEAGTGYAMGWHYNDTTEGRGFNPLIGLGYTRIINSKWSVHTGLQITSVGYLSASAHVIKHINNDFGYHAVDSAIKTTRLFYATMPLQIQYNLNDDNQVGFGGTFSYLITGYGKIETSTQTDDAGITGKKETSKTGYVKGFNPFNASLNLIYTRRFSGKFSASVIPYFGLLDTKDNSFFIKQKFERDMGVKLILSYTIFK